ncbi:MAG: phosphoribosylaminoimidazolesuccinocarboxamide synthase [Bacteroidia bacterium]|nr:phosphoribosylaminoimidazolesuccinocarboxamide synthase [Bacteroidia bacterium]
MKGITSTEYHFNYQTGFYRGKVRDVYYIKDKYVVMVATDRISAFDVILPRPIPGKGAILNQMAAHFLMATKDICPNWLIEVPFPNISIGYKCEPIRVEMVVRGYLAGHAARQYKAGRRTLCGVPLPEGLKENDPFPTPIITPTTKAEQGHDEDISREEILKKGLVKEEVYAQMEQAALALFKRGTEMAKERGLILVDTKYEFGLFDGKLMVMDEIHTPDSSRYFYLEGYEERQRKGEPQKQLSKEFVREWLIQNGFQGKEGQQIPEMTDEKVREIRARYEELYRIMLGKDLTETDYSTEDVQSRINEILEGKV